jgi:chorismate synthase
MSDEIHIRLAHERSDCDRCVLLQRAVWGLQDLEITSAVQLISGLHAGALLHVAETSDGQLVGFAWAFPALRDGACELHSDMLAVLPERQGRGLGARLKWAQREEALRRGVQRITWTYDPLQARNATLNLRRLGGTATHFYENFYGLTSSPLHHGLPTDRLLVSWELRAPRVEALSRVGEPPATAPVPELPHVNVVKWQAGWPVAQEPELGLRDPELLLEIPPEWDVLYQAAPRLAASWHEQVRRALRHYLGEGYVAADFVPADDKGRRRPLYLLRRA